MDPAIINEVAIFMMTTALAIIEGSKSRIVQVGSGGNSLHCLQKPLYVFVSQNTCNHYLSRIQRTEIKRLLYASMKVTFQKSDIMQ